MTQLVNLVNLITEKFEILIGFSQKNPVNDVIEMNNFEFVNEVHTNSGHENFKFAIFHEKNGSKKAFAKIWEHEKKDYDYYSLLNEIYFYQKLREITTDSSVKTPNLLGYIVSDKKLLLLLEYVEQDKNIDTNPSEIINLYKEALGFINEINKHQSIFSDAIKVRNQIFYIAVFPMLLIIWLLNNPMYWKYIFSISCNFYKSAYKFLKNTHIIVHRSLEHNNIIKSGNQLFLIDFQLVTFGNHYLDYTQTINFTWHNTLFCVDFYNQIVMENLKTKSEFDEFKSVMIYSCLYHSFIEDGNKMKLTSQLITFNNLKFQETLKKETIYAI